MKTRNVPRNIAEKAVMALYLPSAFGRVGKRGKPGKADEIYEDFVSIYQDHNTYLTYFLSGVGGALTNFKIDRIG